MVVNYDMPYDPVEKRPDVETYLHRGKLIRISPIQRRSLAQLTGFPKSWADRQIR